MPEVTDSTIDVVVGDEKFVFAVPGPREMARMGARVQAMRTFDGAIGEEGDADFGTWLLYRGMALLETLLVKADTKDNWVLQVGDDGSPVLKADKRPLVDSNKFPPKSIATVREVYRGFNESLNTFLATDGQEQQPGKEAVGGLPTPA